MTLPGDNAFEILRQGVFDGVPRRLRADPDVCERPAPGIGVKGPQTYAPNFGFRVAAAVDRGTTTTTERPELAWRRFVLRHEVVAAGDSEVLRSGRSVGSEGGAGSALALLAVAVTRWPELALDPEEVAHEVRVVEGEQAGAPPLGRTGGRHRRHASRVERGCGGKRRGRALRGDRARAGRGSGGAASSALDDS